MHNKLIFIIICFLSLSACGVIKPYRPDVSQGNIMTEEMLTQLRIGMTKEQVLYLMGTPVLEENFNPNRWDYVYTHKPTKGDLTKKRISLYFTGNIVTQINGITLAKQQTANSLPAPLSTEAKNSLPKPLTPMGQPNE